MLAIFGLILILGAVLIALHTGTYSDGGLRIFDGGTSFALAIVGASLVAG